ncbi:hypothetical protein CEUSTIGMA_g12128.t1 [Chlamydomonas eustigma]|uniref:Magnesium transporter n=1 Tax=Chlamydomonas eustigma TaxID=1157962 RepID=A0A250XNW4_9CHLO|nr:hypothetical protein CEUSTIGMA_g12128.t1 [Chlamydomonas eustigma]|eukprot:GAX84706.1 hypothetical protein CEUSTIGMA_g12128.t1 [Chlamydomonas eustigma]
MASSASANADDTGTLHVGDNEGYEHLIEQNAPDSQDEGLFNAQKKKITSKRRAAPKSVQQTVRSWLQIDPNGETTLIQADKHKLTNKLGIQARDLRLLDPHFSAAYPSCVLCRDKSMLVNLEHIKAIITSKFILVVNPEEASSLKFISTLKERLAHPDIAIGRSVQSISDLQRAGAPVAMPLRLDMDLPFELRALEICLDELATEFDLATTELEATAYPSLDSLASKVTHPKLERVRRIKNMLVRLTTRVQTVLEILEKFLNDDEDMHDLNLTAHEANLLPSAERDLATVSQISAQSNASTDLEMMENEIAEVEMLLEAYFIHYDNTFNRLKTLSEFIKDTEDLVNIRLDQHRNQLITTDLLLTAFAFALGIIVTIVGVFGMNLDSGLQNTPHAFKQVTIASCVGAIMLFIGFVVFARRRGLLSWG